MGILGGPDKINVQLYKQCVIKDKLFVLIFVTGLIFVLGFQSLAASLNF
jgi:hypothetical protein